MEATQSKQRPTVLITGVSTGIGFDTARELIAHGFRVLGSVRKIEDGTRVKEALGEHFTPLFFDVTDADAIARAVPQVQEIVGAAGLAGLVNNAGIAPMGPLMHMPLPEFQRCIDINVFGVLRVTQAFLPLLGARKNCPHPPGRIVNLSSISGGVAFPLVGAYACSKHALEAMTDALRRELGIYGTVRLPRLVGRGRALEIILGSGDFRADVAERYGYVNRALPPEEMTYFVNSLAYRIATFPAQTIALAKQAVAMNDAGIEDALVREEQLFLQAAHTDGAKRRMAAAMAAGMQTPAMEMCCFDHIWGPLAGV